MVKQREPDESSEESKESPDLESMVKEAIEHYKASDFKQLANCIKDIIAHCESSEEESNDLHSQNEKAAKEQE